MEWALRYAIDWKKRQELDDWIWLEPQIPALRYASVRDDKPIYAEAL
jgi:hypothetical protein